MLSHRQSSGADATTESQTTTVNCTTHKPSGWRAASGACYAISCFGVSDPGDRMQNAVGLLQCGKPREEIKSPMPRANGDPLSSVAMPRGPPAALEDEPVVCSRPGSPSPKGASRAHCGHQGTDYCTKPSAGGWGLEKGISCLGSPGCTEPKAQGLLSSH